jgi:Na+/H+ antiporter NhaD/arsenite permease-like protein
VFPWHNDWFSVMFVSLYAMVGGYSNTLIYQYAGASVPAHESSRAASIINVSLIFGVFAAIPLQFIFGPMLSKH